MSDGSVTATLEGQVWRIGITRPARRNALNGVLFAALGHCLALAQSDERVHCVLLHGLPDCFCAGHDTGEFATQWPQSAAGPIARCIQALANLGKPLVAAVNGPAVGFGATLLLHADVVIAAEHAMFRFPFADLGIVPEAGATALLARRVGELCARDWLLSGRKIGAEEALQRGLVSRVVADADVLASAQAAASMLAAKPAAALQRTRQLLQLGSTSTGRRAILRELDALNHLIPAASWRAMPHA